MHQIKNATTVVRTTSNPNFYRFSDDLTRPITFFMPIPLVGLPLAKRPPITVFENSKSPLATQDFMFVFDSQKKTYPGGEFYHIKNAGSVLR